jgi:LAO/AO transport system kinase
LAFHTYLLRCADGSYYCGHTDDMASRMRQHEEGSIGYTSARKPFALVWDGEFESRAEALAFELEVKGWSRKKKEALIAGDWERMRALARNQQGLRPFGEAQDREAQPEQQVEPQPQGKMKVESERKVEVQSECEMVSGPTPHSVRPEPACPELRRRVEGSGVSEKRLRRSVEGPAPNSSDLALQAGVLANDRRALAKAITLIESTRPDHRVRADELLNALIPATGQALRLGISGVPGVGKSTFIEALGLFLIERGHRVAVLTVDPSSSLSGGSILGDKTRMEKLSMQDAAFIRPSPASGNLGGVAEKTREAMLVCEAAGYDVVIVETVGVGQSEIAVAVGLVDRDDVGELEDAALDALQLVAGPGQGEQQEGVDHLGDGDLVLANAHRLDDDHVVAGGLEHEHRLAGRAGHTAELAARGAGADEGGLAGGELGHPGPVTEDRAAGAA